MSRSWATQVPFEEIRCAEMEIRLGVFDWNHVPRHSKSKVHSRAPARKKKEEKGNEDEGRGTCGGIKEEGSEEEGSE